MLAGGAGMEMWAEVLEDEGLYEAITQVRDESPLDKEAALALPNIDED